MLQILLKNIDLVKKYSNLYVKCDLAYIDKHDFAILIIIPNNRNRIEHFMNYNVLLIV